MSKLSYPIHKSEAGVVSVLLPKSIYGPDAIRQTAYKFSGDFNIIVQENSEEYEVTFESKSGAPVLELLELNVKDICNDFIDQQIRFDTEKQFGNIRNLIVEEAFKPINKLK